MDEDGEVLTRQGDRSVAGFQKTLDSLAAWMAAKKKVAGGDAKAKKDLFLAEVQLGKLKAADAKAKVGAMGFSAEELKEVNLAILGLEIKEVMDSVRSKTAVKKLLPYKDRAATLTGPTAERYWQMLSDWAKGENDKKLQAECEAQLKRLGANDKKK